jgi:tetratricopeptide (TPR) repeat protein
LKIDPANIKATTGLLECNLSKEIKDIHSDSAVINLQLNSISTNYPNDPMPSFIMGEMALSRAYYIPAQNIMYFNFALDYYNDSLKIDKNVTSAYVEKGYIFGQEGDIDNAIKMDNEALNISNWEETANNNLGYAYYEKQDYQNAIYYYKRSIEMNPFFLLPYFSISNSYLLESVVKVQLILQMGLTNAKYG